MKRQISNEHTFLHPSLSWLFLFPVYKVSFDTDYLYCSRPGRAHKIGLDRITDVKTGIFPFRIFHLSCYIITIRYSEDGSKKKIRFFSKGKLGIATVRDIPHIGKLREYVLHKKYGRPVIAQE